MMRDNRKNREYYIKYLDYQYSRIENKVKKLNDSDEEKKQRILVSLTNFEIDLLKAEFSFGATKEKMRLLLIEAINRVTDYKKITYEDLLTLLSMSIFVDANNEAKKIINSNRQLINSDRLLTYLSTYIETNRLKWDDKLNLQKDYKGLNVVFENDKKDDALLSYLSSWYENHSEYSWYDSHKKSEDTYCGYWSFESAAIVITLGIDDSKIKKSEFYPSFFKE